MTETLSKRRRLRSETNDNCENERVSSCDEDNVKIWRDQRATAKLPSKQAKILRSLIITLRNEVPPQHQIERSAGSRVPSAEEKEEFEKIVSPIRRGLFDPEEDQIIVNNWKEFCQLHKWTPDNPKPFLFLRHNYAFYLSKTEERKKFVQFLADGLPNRTLYSVYHRFRNLYDPHNVKKYTYQEDECIIQHIERKKNINETRKFADLAKVLNRTRASVWRRYRLLKKKRNMDSESE